MMAEYGFLDHKKIQELHLVQNLILNIFILGDRFNIPDGLKDMGISN